MYDLDYNELLEIAYGFIEETNNSFFLTGKAGTGKTTFLKELVKTTSKNCVIVAPTGIAAVNVGGVTIHSFFQFPLRPLLPEDEDVKVFRGKSEKRRIISALNTLIIDEVSMVRADIIDGIDCSLRRNGGNPILPFGGKQVVFVGDIYQLEPVTHRNSGEREILSDIYESSYFFNALVFKRINLFTIELQKVYRQTDPKFVNLLDKVRLNEILKSDIDTINSRVFPDDELKKKDFAITLTTTNDIAEKINSTKLLAIKNKLYTYTAEISGEFEDNKYPTEPELHLKEGSQIIFVKNDIDKRWVNGTIGKVYELTNDEIRVKLKDDSIHSVEKRIWENIKYQYSKEKKKITQEIVGTFEQFPLRLAWAITIHKSQGLTFDKIVIDFGNGTFASGQAYVALSRVTSFESLFLKQIIHNTDIYVDEKIKEFAKSFNNKEVITQNLNIGRELFPYQLNNDFERIGGYYFNQAIKHLKIGNFKLAFDEFMIGFDNITCDCRLSGLIGNNKDEINQSFKKNIINCTSAEYDLIRAVYYFFIYHSNYGRVQTISPSHGLSFIDSFLEENTISEIGHYLKGRILAGIGNFEEATLEMELALNAKKTSRAYYRIGRYKEQNLQQFGIDYLYRAVVINPSSPCCISWLKNIADKRGIKLQTNTNKFLANEFNSKTTEEFIATFSRLFPVGRIRMTDENTHYTTTALEEFIIGLKADGKHFGVHNIKKDDN